MKKKSSKSMPLLFAVLGLGIVFAIVSLFIRRSNSRHEYYCDGFMLTVDEERIDLKEYDPVITAVVELLPITKNELAIMCRVGDQTNKLLVYDFKKKTFSFERYGDQMAWITDAYDSFRYLSNQTVYDRKDRLIYQAESGYAIDRIEYVGNDFKITLTDENYENPTEIWNP